MVKLKRAPLDRIATSAPYDSASGENFNPREDKVRASHSLISAEHADQSFVAEGVSPAAHTACRVRLRAKEAPPDHLATARRHSCVHTTALTSLASNARSVYNIQVFARPGLVRDEVYQHLRGAIMDGELVPGDKLGEVELGARYGVSRTPIREALQRLVQEGLLATSAGRGVWVRQVDAREARDTYAVRENLDGLAAELAARHHTPDDATRLQHALGALESASANARADYREQTRLDLAYHREVVRASHNVALADLARALEQRVALIKHRTRTYNAHPDTSRQHHAILKAVLERDEAAAREAARAHVRTFAALVLRDLGESGFTNDRRELNRSMP